MEGRHPPPPASHPFTDNPRYDKFWGTPTMKGYFKFATSAAAIWVGLLSLNMYLTRNDTNRLGIKIPTTEEVMKRKELLEIRGGLGRTNVPVEINIDNPAATMRDGNYTELTFDDDSIVYITNERARKKVKKKEE